MDAFKIDVATNIPARVLSFKFQTLFGAIGKFSDKKWNLGYRFLSLVDSRTSTIFSLNFEVAMKNEEQQEVIILAGGCFWGVEELFRKVTGVLATEVGYTGGDLKNPTYNDVKTGTTGHAEAIKITFTPSQIELKDLLTQHFFRLHDPTTLNRQGNDVGSQYRSEIFYSNEQQRTVSEEVIQQLEKEDSWTKPIVTKITQATEFWSAEDFHQNYLQKNPGGYTCHFYR